MIHGIGIDLVEIERIRAIFNSYGDHFLDRFFSNREIIQMKKRNSGLINTLAGHFSAREAVIKALGNRAGRQIFLREIEILNDESGRPYVVLAPDLTEKIGNLTIHISVTHEKNYAAAVAVLSDED